jgi:hypothetical protein
MAAVAGTDVLRSSRTVIMCALNRWQYMSDCSHIDVNVMLTFDSNAILSSGTVCFSETLISASKFTT